MQNLQNTKDDNFPLNFILYPAFYSSAYSDDLLEIISEHIVNNFGNERKKMNVDQFYYKTELKYPSSSKSGSHAKISDSNTDTFTTQQQQKKLLKHDLSFNKKPKEIFFCSQSGKMKTIFNYVNENNFDMRSIITPNEETIKLCGKSIRQNTTISLIHHNLAKKKENEGLNEAKRKFVHLQQLRKQQQLNTNFEEEQNGSQLLLSLEDIPDTQRYYHHRKMRNLNKSQSPSTSPVISDSSGNIMFDDSITGRNELRECIRRNGIGSFDLMAVVCTLQTYFKESGRFLRTVNKNSFGFTIKISSENQEHALQFIEDLEIYQEKPINGCTITFKKTYYNFHVSCKNQKHVENVIDIYMKKHVQSKLSLKIFTV